MRTFWQIIRNWPSWFLLIYFYLPFGCNWLTHAVKVFLIRLTEIKSQGHREIDIHVWYRYFDELTVHGWQCQYLFSELFLYSPIMFCALHEANGWLILELKNCVFIYKFDNDITPIYSKYNLWRRLLLPYLKLTNENIVYFLKFELSFY